MLPPLPMLSAFDVPSVLLSSHRLIRPPPLSSLLVKNYHYASVSALFAITGFSPESTTRMTYGRCIFITYSLFQLLVSSTSYTGGRLFLSTVQDIAAPFFYYSTKLPAPQAPTLPAAPHLTLYMDFLDCI